MRWLTLLVLVVLVVLLAVAIAGWCGFNVVSHLTALTD